MRKTIMALAAALIGCISSGQAENPDAALIEAQKKSYPLETCVVSQEKLGEMGEPYNHVYSGKNGDKHLVRFCCKGCIKEFDKDPAKYMSKLSDAVAKKS